MNLRNKIMDRIRNSSRFVDIFQNKLIENGNKRGNIIFNSLGQHKRERSKHAATTNPVADPKVYSVIGKLHQRSRLPPNAQILSGDQSPHPP